MNTVICSQRPFPVIERCADFDWEHDTPPRHSWSDTVIYATRVSSIAADPGSGVESPETFGALIQKIPFLKDLGITAVELLPVQDSDPRQWQTREFKEMVRCLHAADIELIVDIGFTHPEGAVGANARQFILDALRDWVANMHVDGFRLDLEALSGRDRTGGLLWNPGLLEEIAEDPVLRDTKLIAPAWGTAGAYRTGSFSARPWAQWNTHFRDDARRFWRGDAQMAGAVASRMCGSEDLYAKSGKGPQISVNFVNCHHEFTLNDLIHGVEGPTTDAAIEVLRQRQIRNFLLTLFVSRGVPMLLEGDELQKNPQLQTFVKRMTGLRRAHPMLSREEFYSPLDMCWFSPGLGLPKLDESHTRALSCVIRDADRDELFFMFNAEDKPMTFHVPSAPAAQWRWHLAIDTASDLPVSGAGPVVPGGGVLELEPHSAAVLVADHEHAKVAKNEPSGVVTGCNPAIEDCARAMGGDDPDAAYAAASLWYQGYPEKSADEAPGQKKTTG